MHINAKGLINIFLASVQLHTYIKVTKNEIKYYSNTKTEVESMRNQARSNRSRIEEILNRPDMQNL